MPSFISTIHFFLLTVIFCDFIKSEFVPLRNKKINNTSTWKSGRTKRSLADRMPYLLLLEVKYGEEEQINLLWTQQSPHLANEHLPVIMPFADSTPNIMADVGDFMMYYDPNRCSAVVYFEKLNAFYGVIGMNYQIVHLPFAFNEKGEHRLGVIGKPYIQKNGFPFVHINPSVDPPPPSDVEAWVDYLRPFTDNTVQIPQRPSVCSAIRSANGQRIGRDLDLKIIEEQGNTKSERNSTMIRKRRDFAVGREHFLEILVFVTQDIVDIFKDTFGTEDYIKWIVRYFIVYFNAVDMIFHKFRSTSVRLAINIAKIVIEDDLIPFDFITNGELQFSELSWKLPQFLEENRAYYTPDSFDHVFIHTSRAIMDGVTKVNGFTEYGADLYEARKYNQFYNVVPITAVQFQSYYNDYLVAAHEIGRILNLALDPKEAGLESTGQCFGIMQRQGPKCNDCLRWSTDSQKQFEIFLSTNRNNCFLLNKPRSIYPSGARSFLTPFRQCQCYGYHSHSPSVRGRASRTVGFSGCTKPLQCATIDGIYTHLSPSVRPFDGTSCALRKVCWNEECVPTLASQRVTRS